MSKLRVQLYMLLAVVMVGPRMATAACTGMVSLNVTASDGVVCKGCSVTLDLTASDCDWIGSPICCWENLQFDGWGGPSPAEGRGVVFRNLDDDLRLGRPQGVRDHRR